MNRNLTLDFSPISESPGTSVGRYRLMEQIGEGGMGIMFVAEQERPVRRRVAIKIVKAGMDTKDVVARFEAERQALALMDHPNIAKVFDAGSTESGRPYFVMELVRGVPVTEYCDKKRLSVLERLELFVQVCQAVQHPHQKGIIHRDIKPTNVLVADHDGKPVPKVIDFGVAKATNQRLTECTIYTRLQQIIGTPMYMSPEQAEFSGLDVDTRSDIYSLGVLLYELLTGVTPFDKERFARAAYGEIQRIIRDEEPPKPSTKISVLGATATEVSNLLYNLLACNPSTRSPLLWEAYESAPPPALTISGGNRPEGKEVSTVLQHNSEAVTAGQNDPLLPFGYSQGRVLPTPRSILRSRSFPYSRLSAELRGLAVQLAARQASWGVSGLRPRREDAPAWARWEAVVEQVAVHAPRDFLSFNLRATLLNTNSLPSWVAWAIQTPSSGMGVNWQLPSLILPSAVV